MGHQAGAGRMDQMVSVWKEVLRVPEVGPDDDLFELGGHSMTAALLVRRINKSFDASLPLVALYRNPTVRGVLGCLDGSAD
jgi:hypothetical protein